MRAYVDLPARLDHVEWGLRHARDEVPDDTPYGLHRLADHGIDVTFRRPHRGLVGSRLADAVSARTGGDEFVEAVIDSRSRHRAHADVLIGYDERTSVPAALLSAIHAAPPVLAGVGWLTTRAASSRLHARLAAAALPRAGLVWAQCAPMLPLLTSEWGVPRSKVRYVPFGIDTDFYGLQPPPERPGLVVGAGEDRFRDHQGLIDAVAMLRRRRPDARLELATGLPVRLPPELGTVHTERLNGRMRQLYQRSSVVALALQPSLTGSGLTVILEAMASGRPVVATANPGLDEYIEQGVNGLLVPVGDTDALAAAIGELLDDPQRSAEMGAAGSRWVRERFTSDVMAAALADLARELG